MVGSALFFSLNHILRKKILENSNVLEMMIITGSMGFLMMLPFIGFIDFNVSPRNLFLILINAVLAISGTFLLNIAYKNCEISTVSPLLNINPLFVILLSYFALGEVLNNIQFAGVVLILIGGYIITLKSVGHFFRPFTSMPKKYFLLVLTTLVLWSFCPILIRIVILKTDALTYMFFYSMSLFWILIIVMVARNKFLDVIALAKERWLLLAITSLFWVTSDFLQMAAIAIPSALVSLLMPVKRISNLFTVTLGGSLFKEKNLKMKSTACVIMLIGLFVIGVYS
jgi:bacterial/archaeal transporter family protein